MRHWTLADGGGAGPRAVAATQFAAVLALRLAVHGTTDAISLLFVLPIALLAVAFGARVGAAAGLTGVLLVVMWAAVNGVTLSPLAPASPSALMGAASDRLGGAADVERR